MDTKTDRLKKLNKCILFTFAVFIAIAVFAVITVYGSRLRTILSISRVTGYEDNFDLYTMDVSYNYDLDRILSSNLTDTQAFFDAIIKESLPFIPIHIQAPDFACCAFSMPTADNEYLMGRNYDFDLDTSALLVRTHPKNGYSSISFAALDNIGANRATDSFISKASCLAAPFVILDGVNEKGVSICVLQLRTMPTCQDTGKPKLPTTLAMRLVLDRAASTDEAIELLSNYDMVASAGCDYHFYVSDADGNGVVVEYDCDSAGREMTVTPAPAVTNFVYMYRERADTPKDYNKTFSDGMDRYKILLDILETNAGNCTTANAWEALEAASVNGRGGSRTQWSIVYNNTKSTADVVLRRNWNDVYHFDLK